MSQTGWFQGDYSVTRGQRSTVSRHNQVAAISGSKKCHFSLNKMTNLTFEMSPTRYEGKPAGKNNPGQKTKSKTICCCGGTRMWLRLQTGVKWITAVAAVGRMDLIHSRSERCVVTDSRFQVNSRETRDQQVNRHGEHWLRWSVSLFPLTHLPIPDQVQCKNTLVV